MTPDNDSRPVGATPARATAVAGAILFTDMLLEGLAIPVLPLLPAVVEQGEAATGVLFSSYAAAMIVATLITGRVVDRRGPKGPLRTELIVLVAATLLFATGGPYWLLLVARFVQGIAGGIAWVAALSLIAAATGIEKRGQMMGIAMSTVTLGVLAGPPLGGILVDAFGPASPFLIAAAIAIVDVALVGIIANPVVGRLMTSVSSRSLVGAGNVAVAAALLVIGWSAEVWQIGIGMGLLGLSSAMLLAPATTLISEQGSRSTPPTLGGSFALYNLAYAAGLTIGPLLTGFGAQQAGFATAMALTALVFAILGGVAVVSLPAGPAGTTE
ncbi:MFS transporter [[Pseudopropionibacterium] massiliense]|uniref:MFS transporter n=1 Tax=[Pseudopropionibacterium] massiliense TaxID=2220000 RepID=UPI00102F32D6|nr:MFS transporter [[Pseudopropionibacterium] massiliense]